MKLCFLGTGAADFPRVVPHDGSFFRRYSSLLVDGRLLIDPGPHIFDLAEREGGEGLLSGVEYVILTHSHSDHFSPEALLRLGEGGHITFACERGAREAIEKKLVGFSGEIISLDVGAEVTLGGYSILPLASNHATANIHEQTLNYMIGDGRTGFFYGLDSSWIMTRTWRAIKARRPRALILECTIGDGHAGDDRIFEHTSIEMLEIMLATARAQGVLSVETRVFCSHMARKLHPSHEELCRRLSPLGVTPACDGLTVEI